MTPYFAYGSNLWIDQMIERLGPFPSEAAAPRRARLSGYRVAFNMRGDDGEVYANIVPAETDVLGVLYCCDSRALEKLDVFESGYYRKSITVVVETGETIAAMAYVAEPENVLDGRQPSDEYLQRILRGGRQQGLPEAYLHKLAAVAKPDRATP